MYLPFRQKDYTPEIITAVHFLQDRREIGGQAILKRYLILEVEALDFPLQQFKEAGGMGAIHLGVVELEGDCKVSLKP